MEIIVWEQGKRSSPVVQDGEGGSSTNEKQKPNILPETDNARKQYPMHARSTELGASMH
jgi:hypothetical protein